MPAQVQPGWPGQGIPIGPERWRRRYRVSRRSPPFLPIAEHPRHTLRAYLNGPWAGSEGGTCAGFQSRLANYPGGVQHTHNAHH